MAHQSAPAPAATTATTSKVPHTSNAILASSVHSTAPLLAPIHSLGDDPAHSMQELWHSWKDVGDLTAQERAKVATVRLAQITQVKFDSKQTCSIQHGLVGQEVDLSSDICKVVLTSIGRLAIMDRAGPDQVDDDHARDSHLN